MLAIFTHDVVMMKVMRESMASCRSKLARLEYIFMPACYIVRLLAFQYAAHRPSIPVLVGGDLASVWS